MNLLAIIAMSFSFLLAPRVQVGSEPLASDMWWLAQAANAKDRSGLGDFHYRLSDYCINWARQIRNSDELGNTPSMGEYWELYAYLNPKNDIPSIPLAGPGEPEGSNLTCPPAVYQFGNATANLANEEDRLGVVDLWFAFDRPAQTHEEWWIVGQRQRGVSVPGTFEQNAPAIAAARSAQNIFWSVGIPHGKTTGGFLPTPPKLLDDCDDGTGDIPIPSWQYFFTALRDDVTVPVTRGAVSTSGGRSVITYAGSCPWNTLEFAGNDVQGISRLENYYLIFFLDGFEILSRVDWLEGPYSGEGQLTRYNAEHFSRATTALINDFRGTPSQRNPDDFEIEKIAFDFEAFFGKQYHLAPNIGIDNGVELVPIYPRATASGSFLPSSTLLKFDGQTERNYAPGYVFSGCFAKATNLTQPVSLQVLNGDKIIKTLTLTPAEPQTLFYSSDAISPTPLSVKLVTDAHFDTSGEIIFEANEIVAYKPDRWDAAMLIRLASTRGGDENGTSPFVDGSGNDYATAKQIYTDYATLGCVVNPFAAGVRTINTAINQGPTYEANRRLLNSLFRMVRRHELLSYETDLDGLPILRVKRYAFGLKNIKADIFEGIAPSYEGVSEVVEGVEYVVRSHTGGTIVYGGHKFKHLKRFVGGTESKYDTNGDALLLEYEGIRPTAAKKGWTNEWLMSEEFHFEHPSPTSLWYPDHYADWYVRGNRCHTYALSMSGELSRIADLPVYPGGGGIRQLHLSPEAPSGWNYTLGANATASADFCSSCPIYKAPYELKSVTVEFDPNGYDVCVLKFKAPFQRDASAPATFGRDPMTWNIAALRAEPYRTTDNGLREYFYYLASGTHGSWKIGDGAAQQNGGIAGLQSLPDNPFGCIFPRLMFTSLVKGPRLDGNNVLDANDTRITIDELFKLEIKLKCWCEGAVDGLTSVQHICGGGFTPFNFTYENLKFNAFGGRSIGRGHGPIPNTHLDAESFNQIGACLDQLFMFRLDGIMKLQARAITHFSEQTVVPQWGSGACPPTITVAAIWEGAPPNPAQTSVGAWGDVGGFSADSDAGLSLCATGGTDGQSLGLISRKTDVEYRYVAIPGFENAIPPNVQGLIDNLNVGVIGNLYRSSSTPTKTSTTVFGETACSSGTGGGPGAFWDGTSGFKFGGIDTESNECVLLTNGKLSAGNPPSGAFSVCSYSDSSFHEVSHSSSSSLAVFTPLNDAGSAIIVVPLVAPEEVPT